MKIRFGIRFRFITLLVLLTIIPLLITGFVLTKINEGTIKLQIKESQLFMTTRLSDISRSLLKNTCKELGEIAGFLNDRELSTFQAIKLAKYRLSNSATIEAVDIFNSEGIFLDSLGIISPKDKIVKPANLEKRTVDTVKKRGCLPGNVIRSGNRLFLEIYSLWKNDNRAEGIFRTKSDITDLNKNLFKIVSNNSSYGVESAYIFDSSFKLITKAEIKNRDKGKEGDPLKEIVAKVFEKEKIPKKNIGISSDLSLFGERYLVNMDLIPSLNWVLITLQNHKSAYSPLYEMQKKILIIAAVFILIAVILGIITGSHLSSPILKIAEGAKRFAGNEFSYRIKGIKSGDEIGEVADAFNFLGKSLEEYDARIKKEVAVRSDLSRYLAPELVDSVISRKADLNLGGKRGKIAVLFADIVGSTEIANSRSPEEVVSLLNELFTILTEIIFRNRGMIDKFIGDAVMALFGVPKEDPDAVDNAVNTAREMLRWLEVGNKKWKKEFGLTIKLSVSVNYGDAIIGNIGSKKRMEFTAIGDVINRAAKIEKLALENQILITGSVLENLKRKEGVRSAGIFKIPGVIDETELYEVL